MFNCSSTITDNQMILLSHNSSAISALIIFYLLSSLIFLLVGLFTIDRTKSQHPYQKFFIIWIIATLLIGVLLLFLIFSPFLINSISEFFSSII